MGIGDWGLGIGPNPQSPIPNPQSPNFKPHISIISCNSKELEYIINCNNNEENILNSLDINTITIDSIILKIGNKKDEKTIIK